MDLDLPDLDMKPPDELDADATLDEIEEDIAIQEEEEDPFIKPDVEMVKQPTKEFMNELAETQKPIKPAKKKREMSQKQLDHLARCRELAKEKREAKKRAKEEALAKVKEEHKPKSYKPEKHRAKVEREYKKKTIKVEDNVKMAVKEEDTTPEDFNVSHKAERKKQQDANMKAEQMSFVNFMTNMERYKMMKGDWEEAKKKYAKSAKKEDKKEVAKPPPPQKIAEPINLGVKSNINDNPYSGLFG